LAFLAREAHAPLHLQHCHVFRTSSPDQAEDLNMLIGNAFRSAYAHQLHDKNIISDQMIRPGSALGFHNNRPHLMQSSRSADSLLSPDVINEDQGIADLDEPVYETPDFSRTSNLRHSEQTFQRRTTLQKQFASQRRPLPSRREDFFSIKLAPESKVRQQQQPPAPPSVKNSKPKIKPNTLPVLNCLFAALGKHQNGGNVDEDNLDDTTPYADFSVPDLFNHVSNNNGYPRQYHQSKLGSSFTQDDLRIDATSHHKHQQHSLAPQGCLQQSQNQLNSGQNQMTSGSCLATSGCISATSGQQQQQQYYVNQRFNNSRNLINKSKSAHVISCEVYSEVADHAAAVISNTEQNQLNLTTLRTRRPGNWNVDSIRQTLDSADLIVSPGCNSSRNGSSGFSSGEASTNSSATTPPPTISHLINDGKSILEEPELRTASWFQDGMPRDLSLEVLKREPEGSFIVRASNSKNGLALSVRVPQDFHPEGIVHYLIIRSPKGFKIKGCQKQFLSVTSLLIHHSVMPEMLPCPLLMNRYSNPAFKGSDDSEGGSIEDGEQDLEDDNYLDPERDYDLINNLRRFIMTNNSSENQEASDDICVEDAHFQATSN